MSTFGKKALVWWNYEDHKDLGRFNNTPSDIQLSILEKWYPIGFRCHARTNYYGKWGVTSSTYTIDSYVETLAGYRVVVRLQMDTPDTPYAKVPDDKKHPMMLCPTDDYRQMIKRNSKLNRILGDS